MNKREFGQMLKALSGRYPSWQQPLSMVEFAECAWHSLSKYSDGHLVKAFKWSSENHDKFPTLSQLLDAVTATREPVERRALPVPENYEPITAAENARRISKLVDIFDGKQVEQEDWMDERLFRPTMAEDVGPKRPTSGSFSSSEWESRIKMDVERALFLGRMAQD